MAYTKERNNHRVLAKDNTDHVNGIFCDNCKSANTNFEAVGYCVHCVEYLCKTCYDLHRKSRAFSHHQTQDRDKMPRASQKIVRLRDVCVERCPSHKENVIRYFCQPCKKLCCSVCISISHCDCDKVVCIANIAQNVENSTEFKEFTQWLDLIATKLKDIKAKLESNRTDIERYRKEAKTAIKEQRAKINTLFDKLETDIDQKVEHLKREDESTIQSATRLHSSLTSDIQALKSDLDKKVRARQHYQLFVSLNNTGSEIKLINKGLEELSKINNINRYKFEPSKVIGNIINIVTNFGTLMDPDRKREATYVTKISVKSNNDKTKADINSVCLMSDNQLVAVDFRNYSLKVIDIHTNKVISVLVMQSWPWDVAKITDNQIAVTLPLKKVIQIVFISESGFLSKGQQIQVGGQCCSIIYSKQNLIVSYETPSKVEILDMGGTVLRCFTIDQHGQPLFGSPGYIALSPDHTTIYESDYEKHTVISVNLEGKLKATYKDSNLKLAHGLVVDRTGTVYVCGYWSHNIHQLSADLTKGRILLDSSDGLDYPQCLAYSDTDNKLYVGMVNQDTIQVYKIT